ncbi:MAG: MotA/TolQ/ExbB proton channel family protein [Pseudomonadota bacterium]|nr:MotA/TolQ/ExbB proton channel family protein [Pseudomonadota bacterium]
MYEILMSGGWVMVLITLASILSLAICIERFWTLRHDKQAPKALGDRVIQGLQRGSISTAQMHEIEEKSALGCVLVAGLQKRADGRVAVKEAMELEGQLQVSYMERFLNLLGSIAQIAPLLGLLGTVLGMIDVFAVITEAGADKSGLASGISKALITTAAGLVVAIPSLFFHRYFSRQIEEYALQIEQNGMKLLDAMFNTKAK